MSCKSCGMPIGETFEICVTCGEEIHTACANSCIKCSAVLCDICSLDNEFQCRECNEPEPTKDFTLDFVRRSYIELYKKCPYAFYLQVVLGNESPTNIYAENGIALHGIFDKASNGRYGDRMGGNAIKDKLVYEWSEYFARQPIEMFDGCQYKLTTEEFRDKLYKDGLLCIDNYLKLEQSMPAPWKTEEMIFLPIGEGLPDLRIEMDRINPIPGTDGYEVLDYKTGQVMVGKKLTQDLQAPLYILNVEHNYNIRVDRFRFLYVRDNKERVFNRIDDDKFECMVGKRSYIISLQEAKREVQSIFSRILNSQFSIPDKISGWYCSNQCGMFKRELCAGAMQQSWSNAHDL